MPHRTPTHRYDTRYKRRKVQEAKKSTKAKAVTFESHALASGVSIQVPVTKTRSFSTIKKIEKPKRMADKYRIERAFKRQEARIRAHPIGPLGKAIPIDTPSGRFHLSRQRHSENIPQVTSRRSDFPGTVPVRKGRGPARYKDVGEHIGSPEAMSAVAEDQEEELTPQQHRAATEFLGFRVAEVITGGGLPKLARSVERQVASGERTYHEAFGPEEPTYPPAAPGGQKKFREMRSGRRPFSQATLDAAAAMSDSSDDEEGDPFEAATRRSRTTGRGSAVKRGRRGKKRFR